MSKYSYDLDSIIRNSFKETIKYLRDIGINNREPILRITNSPYLNEKYINLSNNCHKPLL